METIEEPIALKVHETEKGLVISACDKDLVGTKIEEGELIIDILKEFYFDRHASVEELTELLEGCITANLVGEKTINAYCEANPDAKDAVVLVGGVPHLQIYSL